MTETIAMRLHRGHPFDWMRVSHARTPDEAANYLDIEADSTTGSICRVTEVQPLRAVARNDGHLLRLEHRAHPSAVTHDADTATLGATRDVVRSLNQMLRSDRTRVEWPGSAAGGGRSFDADVFTQLDAAKRCCERPACNMLVNGRGERIAYAPRGEQVCVTAALWAPHHASAGLRPTAMLLDGRAVLVERLDASLDVLSAVRFDGATEPHVLRPRIRALLALLDTEPFGLYSAEQLATAAASLRAAWLR